MNGSECKIILSQTITATLEELAFIQLVESDAAPCIKNTLKEINGENYLQDMLSVYLPAKSKYNVMFMSVSKTILKEIACNIFALDDSAPIGEDMLIDTISELLNTVSGQFMRAITPENEFYELGLPVTGAFDMNEIGSETVDCAFETENGDKLFISYVFL